jgi:hypothetical protein
VSIPLTSFLLESITLVLLLESIKLLSTSFHFRKRLLFLIVKNFISGGDENGTKYVSTFSLLYTTNRQEKTTLNVIEKLLQTFFQTNIQFTNLFILFPTIVKRKKNIFVFVLKKLEHYILNTFYKHQMWASRQTGYNFWIKAAFHFSVQNVPWLDVTIWLLNNLATGW